MTSTREPLATGALGSEVRSALRDLSTALVQHGPLAGPDLASGESGVALAHAYLHPLFPEDGHDGAAQERIGRALDALDDEPTAPGLHGGFTGVAWLLDHLGEHGDGEDPALAAEEALVEVLRDGAWDGPYDLIGGIVGAGVLALERLPRAASPAVLAQIVEELGRRSRAAPGGITWTSDPEWLPADLRRGRETPYRDLGVAHGVAGVIAILAGARARGVAAARATELLDGAVPWLLAQRLAPESGGRSASASPGPRSSFPHQVRDGEAATPARTAWCYGDPGIATALWLAARSPGDAAWEAAAIDVARIAAARDPRETGVVEAGLCHGAAGLAHVFHRLHRGTGDAALADSARRWLSIALAMRSNAGGIAGFSSTDPTTGATNADPSYLTGAAGIALAFAAAITEGDPGWDRPLLLSIAGADFDR